jgi:hypothetical protein
MKTFIIFLCFSILLLSQCNRPERTKNEESDSVLRKVTDASHKDLTGYKAIFFVPSSGCGGCISGAEDYLLNTYIAEGKQGFLFVITGHASAKSAKIRLGSQALQHPDVFFDYTNTFGKPPFMQQYPKVLVLDEGQIISEKEVNPESGESIYQELNQLCEI